MSEKDLKWWEDNKDTEIDKMERGYCIKCGKPVTGKGRELCEECSNTPRDPPDYHEEVEYTPAGKSSELGKDPAPTGHDEEEPKHGDPDNEKP